MPASATCAMMTRRKNSGLAGWKRGPSQNRTPGSPAFDWNVPEHVEQWLVVAVSCSTKQQGFVARWRKRLCGISGQTLLKLKSSERQATRFNRRLSKSILRYCQPQLSIYSSLLHFSGLWCFLRIIISDVFQMVF